MDGPVPYEDFRTGLTFGAVKEMLWEERRMDYAATGQYKGIPRARQVKGLWHAIKVSMYDAYLADYYRDHDDEYERMERRAIQDSD